MNKSDSAAAGTPARQTVETGFCAVCGLYVLQCHCDTFTPELVVDPTPPSMGKLCQHCGEPEHITNDCHVSYTSAPKPPVSGEGTGTLTRLPVRDVPALIESLRIRALALTGADWERDATRAMMKEAADRLEESQATLADLRRQGEPVDEEEARFLEQMRQLHRRSKGKLPCIVWQNATEAEWMVKDDNPRNLWGIRFERRPLPDPPAQS